MQVIEEGKRYLTVNGYYTGPLRYVGEGVWQDDEGFYDENRDGGPSDFVDAPPLPPDPSAPRIFTNEAWDRLLADAVDEIRKLSTLKGGEYAGDLDRLANFRRNGERLGLPMETVWAVYAGKHWDAISQYIMDMRNGTVRERLEGIEGRVDDLLVYLLLFKAMLQERGQ